MSAEDHFERLVETLHPSTLSLYRQTKHVRIETAYRQRQFIVYKIVRREPEILDRIMVNDFICDDEVGATTELMSVKRNERISVGFAPVQLFHHPIFVCIPLHPKLRWSTTPDKPQSGSLGFPLVIRTMSRLNLRERGIIYMETGPEFSKEFESHNS